MHAAFLQDESTRGMLCHLLAVDYLLLRHLYLPPPECEDTVRRVGGNATGARPRDEEQSQQLPGSLWDISPRSTTTSRSVVPER